MRVTVLLMVGVVAFASIAQADPGATALASADRDVLMSRINQLEMQVSGLQDRQDASMDQARVAQMKELVQDVMRDSEFRESLFPDEVQVGYDSGFFICNPDDTFEFKIGGVQQFRYTFYNSNTRNLAGVGATRSDRSGFENAATHLWFTGHLFGKDLTFRVQGVWGDNGAPFNVFYTFVNYRFADEFNVLVGLFKNPFGHQELQGAPLQMFAERGMVNEVFNLDRSVGVQLWGDVLDKKLQYKFAVTNGWGTPYAAFDDPDGVGGARQLDQNPAFTARLVYRAMGTMGAGDSDLQYHEDAALQFGMSASYVDNNGDFGSNRTMLYKRAVAALGGGAYANAGLVGNDMTQLGADAQFKWRGLAVTCEYFLRIADVSDAAVSPIFAVTGDASTTHQQGMEVQVGYFLIPKKLEAVARMGGVWDVGPGNECTTEYSMGANYYMAGHNNKLTFDVTKIDEVPVYSPAANFINLNDDITMFRLQWQVMF